MMVPLDKLVCVAAILGVLVSGVAGSMELEESYNLCDVLPGFTENGAFFPSFGDSSMVYINLTNTNGEASYKCLMRFTTCPECIFNVTPISSFRFHDCHWSQMFSHFDGKCAPGCTYLHMFDPDYRNETEKSYITSDWSEPFKTYSKKIYVIVCSNRSLMKNVQLSLNVSVIEKKTYISGSAYDPPSSHSYITSPAFPHFYTENDETFWYQFQTINSNEYIELSFDDWNMSPRSILWFVNSDIAGPVYGNSNRPFVLSEGNELTVKFLTGLPASSSIRNKMGFKATYKFKENSDRRNFRKPITDCGGYEMTSLGGLVNFTPKMSTTELYDCIWVLRRHPDYSMIYTKLIKFDSSPLFYPLQPDNVELRGGVSSLGNLNYRVTHSNVDDYRLVSVKNDTGFYIRLRGRYQNRWDFVLAFASYRYGNCRYNEFRCLNNRCISEKLKCDTYDHCGDDSDERSSLCGSGDGDYSKYSYTISIGVIIPMVISIFLIVVICLLIIFIRRCRTLAQQNPRNGRQTISSVGGNMVHRNRRGRNRSRIRMNLTIQQDSPPSYDEVIRNTPIGYLNMAFMFSQPDINTGMVSPPSYEEVTSPTTTEAPRLTATQNTLNQTAESSSSSDSLESHPCTIPRPSDSSSDGSQMDDRLQETSFSSDSTVRDQDSYPSEIVTQTSEVQDRTPERKIVKPVRDEFIECPVSSATLQSKSSSTSGEIESTPPKTQGAACCPNQGQSGSQGHSRDSCSSSEKDNTGKKKRRKRSSRSYPDPDPVNDRGRNRSPARTPTRTPSSQRDNSGERLEVYPSPPTNFMPVPAPRGHHRDRLNEASENERREDSHDGRIHGAYLSLSLDTGESDPDIFV